MTFGIIDSFVHPGISVDPIGTVRLPLSEEDAHTLTQAGHKAPFGKGTESMVDESMRKTWEMDARKVQYCMAFFFRFVVVPCPKI